MTLFLGTGLAVGQQRPAARATAPQPVKPKNLNGPNGPHPNAAFVEKLRSLPPEQQEKLLRNNRYFQSLPPERQRQIREYLRGGNAPAGRPSPQMQAGGGAHAHPPGFFQEFRDLPPDQQEKVLQNDARFQSLPPERQQQIRENLQRWNNATPAQRQILREREEIVQSLSPEQRDQLRQVFPRWRQLPPDRRQALMQSFAKLRDLPPDQREKFLTSPEVQQHFSPEERGILGDLGNLLPKN
jgi:DNA-directed RNA polymerase subunit F